MALPQERNTAAGERFEIAIAFRVGLAKRQRFAVAREICGWHQAFTGGERVRRTVMFVAAVCTGVWQSAFREKINDSENPSRLLIA